MFTASVLRHIRTFATQAPPQSRKLLQPYDLAQQLRKLTADGDLDAAIHRLRSVPRGAQNVPTWNTMLALCMSQKKFQLAYTLFIDMKRRGFSPNVSTLVTMLKGLSQISDWSSHPKQLANAHALYRYYLEHTQSIKHHDPDNVAQLSVAPLVVYISILGAAGDIQKMFDVYFAMDQDGPLAPNGFVFTAMLRAIASRQEPTDVISVRDTAASDAKHVWLQIEKTMRRRPNFQPDSHLIAAALHALTRGRPADQNLALDIIAHHLGLTRPGHPEPFKLSPHLSFWTLGAALQVCFAMQKFRLCVHFMHLVMDNVDFNQSGVRPLVARTHIHTLLRAHASLALLASPYESSQAIDTLEWCLKKCAMYDLPYLYPDQRTYHLVLKTCLHTGDWEGAIKSFQLMTGIQTHSLSEPEGKASFRVQKRPKGESFKPNAETLSFIVRTALHTKDDTKGLYAFWLSEYVGTDRLLEDETTEAFVRASFAQALASLIDQLLDDPRTENHRERLLSLRARTQQMVHTLGHTLKPEKSVLGDMSAFDEEDDAVSFDLAARSSKPRSN